jgi:outer membrane protein assembly factor BamD (BamD/ComL family)
MRRAREEFDGGRVSSALSILDQFRRGFPSGSDEAWWLYGQCFEARGPNRNIRRALECYRTLVREYPQSPLAEEARRRIAYLKRYYFTIQ